MGVAAEESRSGELLNASYELHELTVPGAVSDSYRATDRARSTTVQVTLLRPEFALQSAVVQRFLHTGKTLTGLRHPNVSQVVAVESDDTGIPFVVEENVVGERLSQTLQAFPDGMPIDMALRIVSPVVEAIAAAHALGIVHGQLDGEHVVLVKSGAISMPKVVRFGAIAASEQVADARTRRAPELRGKDARASADARSDVWALGALLYETLCGRAPSDSAGARSVLEECVPHIPSELSTLVERCLERNPARRPSHAKEVRMELSFVRTSLTPDAPVAPSVPRAQVAASAPKSAPPKPAAARPVEPKPAEPKPAAPKPVVPRPPRNDAESFALGATLFQQSAPKVESARPAPARPDFAPAPAPRSPPARASAPNPKAAPVAFGLDETVAEQPQASQPAARSHPPRFSGAPDALPEIKTMSDLADAFGPIEGAGNIVQSETEGAARTRGFRQAMDAAAESIPKKRPREREERTAPAAGQRQSPRRDAAAPPVMPLQSPKQLKQQTGGPGRAMTQEQVYDLRERLRASEPRSWRAFGDGLLLAFGIALLFMMPFLSDPGRGKAQAALGTHAAIAFIGLAVLAISAVVRTSVMKAQSAPMLLGPLSWTLKIVAACTTVLCAAYNFPIGSFGPAETAARMALPWAASGFFMAGGVYGLMYAVRESASNLVYGAIIGILFSGGFYGSYRTMMDGVRGVAAARAERAAAGLPSAAGSLSSLRSLAAGNARPAGADAGTQQVETRHEVGSSEEQDMHSIEQMNKTNQNQAGQFEQLHQQIQKVAH
jgi:serine/threonine protein kinase